MAQMITSASCSLPSWSMKPFSVIFVKAFVKVVTLGWLRASKKPVPGCQREGK